MREPIRILQVFAQMNRGGAETMIMNIYRNIDRSRVQFDFIVHTTNECDYDEEIMALGGVIYRIPRYSGKNHLHYKKAWNIFFEDHREYRIIHGHVRSTAAIYLRIAKSYELTTIAHSHSISSGRGVSAIIKNILQHQIRYTADYLFACSNRAGEWLFGKEARKKYKFFVLNNAINVRKYNYDMSIRNRKRKELYIGDRLVIGHVGRFNTPKNHEFLIDIFKEVYNKNENVVLLLVGDGELRPLIENKVKDMGLANSVIFTGVRQDVHEIMQAMDVFVFPSLYEGLGMVVVEAQASGLHSVVSNKIPEEAFITDLIQVESLNSSPEKWASKILTYNAEKERLSTYEQIVSKGYEITETTEWLEAFYLRNWKTEKSPN